jgi:hypothetical protein
MTEAELEAEAAAWLERTRAAQGLPPTIEDEAILARVVTLALGPPAKGAKGGGGRAPAA